MSVTRDLPITLSSLQDSPFVTCSTFDQLGSTAGALKSTDVNVGTTTVLGAGKVIDRLGDLLGTARYLVAAPATQLDSTRGSTEANRQIIVGVRLQHGDSSGGGDQVDYSTGQTPADRTYFSTARTSDMAVWDTTGSSGALRAVSNPCVYDLRGAKRFIRAVHTAFKNRVTTESSGDEGARMHGTITFLSADFYPQPTPSGTGYYSSTSSST